MLKEHKVAKVLKVSKDFKVKEQHKDFKDFRVLDGKEPKVFKDQ